MPAKTYYTLWPSYLVLAASLAVTVLASAYIKKTIDHEEEHRFESASQLVRQTLVGEVQRYTDVLLAAQSYFASAQSVSREEWKDFAQSLKLNDRFPGMLALGFAPVVKQEVRDAQVEVVRHEGHPEYTIFPPGERKTYVPVTYIEPFSETNRRAFGYDMFSNPDRRQAMVLAAAENEPRATGRVRLVQDTPEESHPDFLIYVPLYPRGAAIDTPQERLETVRGYVYSAYRVPDLLLGVIAKREAFRPVDFELFDGETRDSEHLLFDSRVVGGHAKPAVMQAGEAGTLEHTETILVAGRPWELAIRPSVHMAEGIDHNLPWVVLIGGGMMSWLLFGVSWLQMRARAQSDFAAARLMESETALRESELRYRLKIEQSPLAVHTLSPDGRTLSVNRAWEELWGVSLEDLHDYNLLKDPELDKARVKHLIRDAFAGNSVSLGTFYYSPPPFPSGKRARARWVRSFLYPVKDLYGTIKELVLIHQDVTDRKQAEEDLRKAKEAAEGANRAKDQFLAVLSHELRNPLSPVLSMVNLLEDPTLSAAETREALDVIRRNVELEARLIDDLLDVTRIARGKLRLEQEIVNAHTLLEHALEICREEAATKHLRLNVKLDAENPVVNADPARMQQICWNLIKNAVKFTPDGGDVTVRTANEKELDGREMLVIGVSDTGIGIDPIKLPHIFDAFEQADRSITRRFGGLGLGLAITKALVEAHGGAIIATSEGLGKGATFALRLPVVHAPTTPIQKPQPKDAASATPVAIEGRPIRLLIVEDQADARRGLTVLLQHHHYDVRAAASGNEAIAIAREWQYDILISDIGLPDLSGFDLLIKLREIHPTPAIALTGFGMEQDVQRAREAGFQEHLTKPIHFERLERAIRTLTASQPAPAH